MDSNILKSVTINDDVYVIKKFTAKVGINIARLIISKAAPLISLLDNDTENGDADRLYAMVGEVFSALSDNDLDHLVDKCLRVCSKQLPAGLQPIIDATGNYGVPDVEYDLSLTIRLCIEAIKWGAADFFDGSRLNLKQLMK